ncbi:MAG: hypothetical protein IBX39_05450 [Candidatus Methanoperedenaceae archaeon]|nr:hypothetical protein [Candidatus Methanoperedenaceae archaeon]
MVIETYLISLNDDISQVEIENILRTLTSLGGNINMAVKKNIIASFDSNYVDIIRKKTGVKLVGGINFKGRKVRKVVKRES